ncbi:MAG: ABC transporter ATP-binding protein [Geminicoccaceae bacterium]
MSVGPGEVLCLLGPNGAGKTTLFRTLLGLVPAQGGSLLLDGRPLATWPRAAIARRIAYVPQAQTAPFAHTVLGMVLMGPFARPGRLDRTLVRDALATLGILHLADGEYGAISGGQYQLALIARALAQASPLLVMDEPTASLDFGNQIRVLQHVRTLRARGLGIVLSTHHPKHAFACATSVALLYQGALRALGPPDRVRRRRPSRPSMVFPSACGVRRTAG